jgi:hypothetical protein
MRQSARLNIADLFETGKGAQESISLDAKSSKLAFFMPLPSSASSETVFNNKLQRKQACDANP